MANRMPSGFWTAALQVGGVATVALFVLWSLYKAILAKVALSQLDERSSFLFLLIFSGLTFVTAVLVIWVWYLRHRQTIGGDPNSQSETAFEFDIPPNWTFRQASATLAQVAGCAIKFEGFELSELNSVIQSQKLQTKAIDAALGRLGNMALSPIRPYRVTKHDGLYELRTEG